MEITLIFTSAIAGSCLTLKEVIMSCACSLGLCGTVAALCFGVSVCQDGEGQLGSLESL